MATLRAPAPAVLPLPVTVAVILSVLVIVANFISPLLPQGTADNTVPTAAIVVGVVFGLLGIPAAIGLWLLRRWGSIATIIVTAINLLLAAPGIVGGPYAWIKALAALFVLVCAAIIVLATRPEARRSYR
jgi:uncharacterized membrane protein (DUF2068 family)